MKAASYYITTYCNVEYCLFYKYMYTTVISIIVVVAIFCHYYHCSRHHCITIRNAIIVVIIIGVIVFLAITRTRWLSDKSARLVAATSRLDHGILFGEGGNALSSQSQGYKISVSKLLRSFFLLAIITCELQV